MQFSQEIWCSSTTAEMKHRGHDWSSRTWLPTIAAVISPLVHGFLAGPANRGRVRAGENTFFQRSPILTYFRNSSRDLGLAIGGTVARYFKISNALFDLCHRRFVPCL